ncbi:hypothetical protein Emag_002465 [Eimeria magna]
MLRRIRRPAQQVPAETAKRTTGVPAAAAATAAAAAATAAAAAAATAAAAGLDFCFLLFVDDVYAAAQKEGLSLHLSNSPAVVPRGVYTP